MKKLLSIVLFGLLLNQVRADSLYITNNSTIAIGFEVTRYDPNNVLGTDYLFALNSGPGEWCKVDVTPIPIGDGGSINIKLTDTVYGYESNISRDWPDDPTTFTTMSVNLFNHWDPPNTSFSYTTDVQSFAVPEPSACALGLTCAVLLAVRKRK